MNGFPRQTSRRLDLTLYGSNLGDQAIHISCIEQLRGRCTEITFTAICLNPARVAALHGIGVHFYSGGPGSKNAIKNSLVAVRNAVRWLAGAWRLTRALDASIVAGGGQLDDEWGGA